ncbi:MAG: sigma-54-dependent transcriptional regulator [Terriglobia bacterium]
MPHQLLVVDDDREVCAVVRDFLTTDYAIEIAYSGDEGLKKVAASPPDLILLDLRLPGLSGLDVLRILRQQSPEVGVVILTGWGSIASAIETTRLGAFDYLVKPIDFNKLKETVQYFFSIHPSSPAEVYERCGIIGNSSKIKKAWNLVQNFAPADVTVLLRGESGTGKEVFARALHMLSKRQKGPFIPLECAGLPETLVESELFGYEKGAFTGAAEKKLGRIETAHRGTFFLDEIGNMPASMQAKLLRVIQEGEIQPLGSKASRPVDVRIVAATNAPLEEAIKKGMFRADLYYRLSAATIWLPPLRERGEDITLLANHFVSLYGRRFGKSECTLHPQALEILQRFHWPGNIRELENVIKSAILLAGKEITPGHLPKYVQVVHKLRPASQGVQLSLDLEIDLSEPLVWRKLKSAVSEQVEQRLFSKLLELSESNPKKLPQLVRIDPKTLRTKLRKLRRFG